VAEDRSEEQIVARLLELENADQADRRVRLTGEQDSTDDLGDFESDGAEIRDMYADSDEDELTQDPVISEEDK
jgi:hypothetical protein